MDNFYDIARELKLASNQVAAIRAILCIQEDVYIDGKTLLLHSTDFPGIFRDWLYCNKPEAVFFPCPSQESSDTDFDLEIINRY